MLALKQYLGKWMILKTVAILGLLLLSFIAIIPVRVSALPPVPELTASPADSGQEVPQAPVDLLLKAASANQVVLTWINKSTNEQGFRIERAADNLFTQDLKTFSAAAGAASFTDNTTEPLKTYFYRVTAFNAAGNSAPSDFASITTPDSVPDAPSNLTVVSTDIRQVTLRWLNSSTNVSGFIVERATEADFGSNVVGFTVIVTGTRTKGDIISATDRQVPGGTFYFRVMAYNSSGNSAPSSVVQATVSAQYPDGNIPFGIETVPLSLPGFGILGTIIQVDHQGYILDSSGNIENQALTLNMSDFTGNFVLPAGAKLLNPNGRPLLILDYSEPEMIPQPPADKLIIGAFNFGPPGATINPNVTLNLECDPASLPLTTSPANLTVVSWDGASWQNVPNVKIDSSTNTVSFNISRLAEVAIITKKPDLSARFSFWNLYVLPQTAKEGEPVYISATVTNKGNSYGYYQAVLTINGVAEDKHEGGLDSGASADIKFICTGKPAGKYSFDISGLKGSFTIASTQVSIPTATSISPSTTSASETTPPASSERPDNTILLMVVGVIALIVLFIIYAFIIRRQH